MDKLNVLICLTDACNLRCKMCHLWQKPFDESNTITIDECKKAVISLKRFEDTRITVHLIGGEPLLKKECLDLTKFICDTGFDAVITTNGYFIDQEIAKKINHSGLTTLNLSLDSLNEEKHNLIRGTKGSHERALKAIEYLYKECPRLRIGINTVILEKNLDDILEMARWANADARLAQIYFMAVMRPFGSDLGWDWYTKEEFRDVWPQDKGKLNYILDELIRMKNNGYKIDNPVSQLRAFKSYFDDPSKFIKKLKCNLGKSEININAHGDLYLCFYKDCLGNIRKDDIKELWHSQQAQKVRKEIANCRQNCELVMSCYYEEEN